MFDTLWNIPISGFQIVLFLLAGFVTGIINTMAGSGSLITLPLFVFMCGLPPDMANGTNRIGVLFQSLSGVLAYNRKGWINWKGLEWLILPSVLGAVAGAWIAKDLNAQTMNTMLGILMIVMLATLTLKPERWLRDTSQGIKPSHRFYIAPAFLAIGFYAGFLQAGTGIFLMILLVLIAKYTLKDSAGIKLAVVFLMNIPPIIIFAFSGDIHWGLGIITAVAQALGALVAIKFLSDKKETANIWIHRVLIAVIILSAAKFLGIYDYLYQAGRP